MRTVLLPPSTGPWVPSQCKIFAVSTCLKDRIDLPHMIGSFANGATASLVAKKGTKKLSQPFEELQGSNFEFKLVTSKSITGTYFEATLGRFGLKGLPMFKVLQENNVFF